MTKKNSLTDIRKDWIFTFYYHCLSLRAIVEAVRQIIETVVNTKKTGIDERIISEKQVRQNCHLSEKQNLKRHA